MGSGAPRQVGMDDYGIPFADAHDPVVHYVATEGHPPDHFYNALVVPLRATHLY